MGHRQKVYSFEKYIPEIRHRSTLCAAMSHVWGIQAFVGTGFPHLQNTTNSAAQLTPELQLFPSAASAKTKSPENVIFGFGRSFAITLTSMPIHCSAETSSVTTAPSSRTSL